MTLRYSGAPSGQDAIKRFPRVNPGLCFHGPSGRRHRAKHIRSAGSTAFAGIRRSILSLARKAELLPNRRQILIPLAFVLYRPYPRRRCRPRIPSPGRTKPRAAARTRPRLTRRFSTNPEKILARGSRNPLPSAKVILASQIVSGRRR
jgi:hypothetical protein